MKGLPRALFRVGRYLGERSNLRLRLLIVEVSWHQALNSRGSGYNKKSLISVG